jgi:hypothetical protein
MNFNACLVHSCRVVLEVAVMIDQETQTVTVN